MELRGTRFHCGATGCPSFRQELRETIANRIRYDRIGYGITFNNFEVAVKDGVVTIAGEPGAIRTKLPPSALSRHSWRA